MKTAILLLAYNAEKTIQNVLTHLPKTYQSTPNELIIIDDCSQDTTYKLCLDYKSSNSNCSISVFQTRQNLGYGGAQKFGFRKVLEGDFDNVVLLHGDGQHDSIEIPQLLDKLDERYDAVIGSRMFKNPLKGGMPLYKFLGNKLLTFLENIVLNMNLSEYHSGFRAYSCKALKDISFENCSDDFVFDTEILIMLKSNNFRIGETAVSTHYDDKSSSISFVYALLYGIKILLNLALCILGKFGLRSQKMKVRGR